MGNNAAGAINDFFGSGQAVSIHARDALGLEAPVAGRNSVNVMERALMWLKANAAPVASAVALAAVAGALSMAPAPAQAAPHSGHAEVSLTQNGSQASRLSSIDAVGAVDASERVAEKASEQGVSQKIIDAYEKNRNWFNKRISESEFGMSQKAVHDLSWSTIAPSARSNIVRLDVIDKNVFGEASISPSMKGLKTDDNRAMCIMQLGGYNEGLSTLFKKPIKEMSPQDAASLRRVVIIHEGAHCEHFALSFAHDSKRETNFVGQMDEVADGFKSRMPNGKMVDYSQDAKSMMWERYADSKTVLFFSKMHLDGLSEKSTDSERALAVNDFKQDVSMLKKLRLQERESLKAASGEFNDHDTLHIVNSLEVKALENAKDPAKWKAWSAKHLGAEQMASTAGSISLGSLLAEREEIAIQKVSEWADELETQLDSMKEGKADAQLKLGPMEEASVQSTALFEDEKSQGSKEFTSLDASDYLEKANNERVLQIELILSKRGSGDTESLIDEESQDVDEKIKIMQDVDERVKVLFPAEESARTAMSDQIDLRNGRQMIVDFDSDISDTNDEIGSVKEVLASNDPVKQAIGEGLSDDSKSFSMRGHAFWSQAKEASGDALPKSFLQENAKGFARAPSQPIASGLMKLLGARPATAPRQPALSP